MTQKPQRIARHLGAAILTWILLASTLGIIVQADGPGPDKLITDDSGGPGNKSQVEPAIAINPNDPNKMVAVAMDYRDNYRNRPTDSSPLPWIYYYVTCNNWTNLANKPLPGHPRDSTRISTIFGRFNLNETGDPGIAFDKADNVYIVGLGRNETATVMFVAKGRLDCSSNPLEPTLDFAPTDVSIRVVRTPPQTPDKPYIAVDSRPTLFGLRIYVVWLVSGFGSVYLSYTHQWGTDFSHVLLDSDPLGRIWHAAVAVAPNGDVHVAYFISGQFIRVKRSTDGGVSFPQASSVSARPRTDWFRILGNARTPPVLSISADPTSNNLIYLVWDDEEAVTTKGSEILFTYSGDYGSTWRSPVRVNDSVGQSEQFWPWIVSPDPGVVDVIFYNMTSRGLIELLYAPSFDLTSFQPNIRVSNGPFNLNLQISDCTPPPEDCYFAGDYIGMTGVVKPDGTQTFIQPVWIGTRDGARSDIYTDRITRPRGGGSPYVHVWNGTGFSLDNNLLPGTRRSPGQDIRDWYRLQKPLVLDEDGNYRLMIKEMEQDHVFLDQVELLEVDHASDVKIAVSPRGEILTYRNPSPPVSATNSTGGSELSKISNVDDGYYEGGLGDYLILDFSGLDVSQAARLVMRTDPPPHKMSLYVQVRIASGDWATVEVVVPRVYWSIDIVDLKQYLPDPFGELKVRIYFTAQHRIDFAGLDTTLQAPVDIHTSRLVNAHHSVEGLVTLQLLLSDDIRAEILPQESIILSFEPSAQTKANRDLIIIVEGYYVLA